jgi:iron complex outermembrane receptor protein
VSLPTRRIVTTLAGAVVAASLVLAATGGVTSRPFAGTAARAPGAPGENEIFENPAQYSNLFVRCSQATASERALIDACGIPGGDPLAYVQNTQLNLGDFESTGFDFSILWNGVATEYGRFSAGYRGTYVTKSEYQIVPSGEFNDNLGNYFNGAAVFRYQHVLNFNWQQGPWSAVLLNRYRSGYEDANAAAGLIDPVYEQNRVGAFSTWDLSVSWAGIKGLTLTAGILNLFDEDPPFTNKGDGFQVGYDERYANPLGRQFLLRAAYEFK